MKSALIVGKPRKRRRFRETGSGPARSVRERGEFRNVGNDSGETNKDTDPDRDSGAAGVAAALERDCSSCAAHMKTRFWIVWDAFQTTGSAACNGERFLCHGENGIRNCE